MNNQQNNILKNFIDTHIRGMILSDQNIYSAAQKLLYFCKTHCLSNHYLIVHTFSNSVTIIDEDSLYDENLNYLACNAKNQEKMTIGDKFVHLFIL